VRAGSCQARRHALVSVGALACAGALAVTCAPIAHAVAPSPIVPGAYRVDLNGKVRDLCVDEIGIAELNAKGWKERLAEQGVRCSLSNVRSPRNMPSLSSWTGTCSAPGMGKIFNTRHDVSVKINDDGSFDVVTLISGDLQARIPVHGERLRQGDGTCNSQHHTFRPWQ
jgi:hypothetical protein